MAPPNPQQGIGTLIPPGIHVRWIMQSVGEWSARGAEVPPLSCQACRARAIWAGTIRNTVKHVNVFTDDHTAPHVPRCMGGAAPEWAGYWSERNTQSQRSTPSIHLLLTIVFCWVHRPLRCLDCSRLECQSGADKSERVLRGHPRARPRGAPWYQGWTVSKWRDVPVGAYFGFGKKCGWASAFVAKRRSSQNVISESDVISLAN
jgi:hypothetical protein